MTKEQLEDKLYWYKVKVNFLWDGDTITAFVLDLGFGFKREVKRGEGGIRFYGINAPEMSTEKGKELSRRLKVLEGHEVFVKSIKDKTGKYGRYLFVIYVPANLLGIAGDYINLNEWLVSEGLAEKV